jgi:Uncharacterized conserved protein
MAAKYRIILHWSEADHAYLAEVPALPGCLADGVTAQQALATAEVIIQEWLDTAGALCRKIPLSVSDQDSDADADPTEI